MVLTTNPLLVLKWKKEYSYTSFPLCAFMECYRVKFTFKLKYKLIWTNCYCCCCLSPQQNMWQHIQIRPLCYGYSHPHKLGSCYLHRKRTRTDGQCTHIISKAQCITNKWDFRLLPWYSWGLPSLLMLCKINLGFNSSILSSMSGPSYRVKQSKSK
jgi:hypothetical protein